MKRFLIAALLVFAFCLAGCGTSHEVPAVQATETVPAETENQAESEQPSKQQQSVPPISATETVPAETENQTGSEKVSEQSQSIPPTLAIETVPAEIENPAESEQPSEQPQPVLPETSQSELQTEEETTDMIKIMVGNNSFFAKLDDNASANELRELLQNGPITMSASNYGGFEKVCSLGTKLASNDVQTTTQAGDIMLYSSNQIVIFYGSNSWAYTRLAKVVDDDIQNLKTILSGSDSEVVIELAEK